jgi:hypothetical protein
MNTFAERDVNLLNHVELFHRPGERDLAVRFFEALGCSVVDVSKEFGTEQFDIVYLCVFPGAAQPDLLNNVLYVSEMHEERQLEDLLDHRAHDDAELRAALDRHTTMRTQSGCTMHFGLRYPDFESVERVLDGLAHDLPVQLEGRVTVHAPGHTELPAIGMQVLQGFVHTDVIGTGLLPFGQLIELQAQQPLGR